MDELKFEWHTEGFVKDAQYSFHLPEVLEPFKQSFPGAERLIVNIRELSLGELSYGTRAKPILISDDRKLITINHEVQKYYDTKGRVTSTPQPIDVFTSLRYLLNRAKAEYQQQ